MGRHTGAGYSAPAPVRFNEEMNAVASRPIAVVLLHRGEPRSVPQADVSRCSKANPYSITSSAIRSNPGGTSMPSVRAIWTLMANTNLVACNTGKSAGLAPLRTLPV